MKSSSLSDNNSKHPINNSFGHSLAMPQTFYPTEVTVENKSRYSALPRRFSLGGRYRNFQIYDVDGEIGRP